MSNPGVIVLASRNSDKGEFNRFEIEDNLGESIHIHIDNSRYDFTIEEFLAISNLAKKALTSLLQSDGINVYNINSFFFHQIAELIPLIESVTLEEIELKQLVCITYTKKGFLRKTPLQKSPAYRYLQGKSNEFLNYKQESHKFDSNKQRLQAIDNSIRMNGYPHNDEYIIIFNHTNIIRDGQHRASALLNCQQNKKTVPVISLNFKGKAGNINFLRVNIKQFLKVARLKIKRGLIRFREYIFDT